MKKQFLSFLGLSLLSFTAQAQWVYQPIGFASRQAAPFYFDAVDANTAWGVNVGPNSYEVPQVATTTNAGQTWTLGALPIQTAVEEDVTGLAAISATTAWVTTVNTKGAAGRILRTTDGGQTWTVQSSATVFGDDDSYPGLIRFFSATEGVAMGEALTLGGGFETYTTANAGLTWTRLATVPATQPDEHLVLNQPAVVGNNIWVLTDQGRVFRSADKGLTWTVTSISPNPPEPTSIIFRDAQNGLVSVLDARGTNHQLFRTTDGGTTWTQVAYAGPLHGSGLSAVPGTSLYVSTGADLNNGDQGSSYSPDNGQTWVALESTLNHLAVEFVSGTVGWSGGFQFSGTQILGGANRFNSTVLGTRADAALQASLNVSPNPATGGLFTLQAARTTSGPATVRVLDVAGRLVQQRAWASAAPLALDLSKEPAGLYVLEVQAASGTARQKVVVQ